MPKAVDLKSTFRHTLDREYMCSVNTDTSAPWITEFPCHMEAAAGTDDNSQHVLEPKSTKPITAASDIFSSAMRSTICSGIWAKVEPRKVRLESISAENTNAFNSGTAQVNKFWFVRDKA
uniref:Uncharacterized protein n=1 Tax=Kwoniella bestiolae CBS 10118 TaxID=1296100 RepID=A0A1B9GEB9_9TREE|nr:hypothetical protein I302_00841 [Kwoniella bestiolae CBS 10118]OCF29339.1 hypothetical protein I302_00841 [Kwoniella bestiolae CBS 10118]